MAKGFFPARPESRPTIYAYADTNPQYDGLLKVGYTENSAAEHIAQQFPGARCIDRKIDVWRDLV